MNNPFEKVGLEVHLKDVSTETLDGVIERKDMHALAVFDVQTLMDVDEIAEFHSQIVTGDFVHLDLALFDVVGAQTDEDSISPLLSPVQRRFSKRRHIEKC